MTFIIGYTTRDHLLLDLDHVSLYKVKRLTHEIMKAFPTVGHCLIVKCADDSWHLVFNNKIGWKKIMLIVEALAALNILNRDYMRIRQFRGDITLRISDKHTLNKYRPQPRSETEVYNDLCTEHDGMILYYLDCLVAVMRIHQLSHLKPQPPPKPPLYQHPATHTTAQTQILRKHRIMLSDAKKSQSQPATI